MISYNNNKLKGDAYEEYVLRTIYKEYDQVWFYKDTPEYIINRTKLCNKYPKYKNCDIGADLVSIKNNIIYFIQCKNYNDTIGISHFNTFYFLLHENDLNGIVYYNGKLTTRLLNLSQGKVKFINLIYENIYNSVKLNNYLPIKKMNNNIEIFSLNKYDFNQDSVLNILLYNTRSGVKTIFKINDKIILKHTQFPNKIYLPNKKILINILQCKKLVSHYKKLNSKLVNNIIYNLNKLDC